MIKEKKIKRDKNASIIYRGEDNSYYEKMLATGEVKCIDEEVPFEIPKGWEWERFGNIMINKDSERVPLSVAQRQQLKKTYDYYGASGVIDKVDKYLFDKDLLLIGEDGANLINRSTPIAFIARGKYWVNNHAHVLDVCSGMALSYVALFINAISLVDYVTGTAQPKMNQEKMNSILLAIPPVKEQHRILEKMSLVDAFVDKYASLQTKLDSLDNSVYELLRKSILQEAIQGKLVPQIAEEGTAQELLEQIKTEKQKLVKEGKLKKSALATSVIFRGDDNKYWEKNGKDVVCIDAEIPFEVPSSWIWCRMGDCVNIIGGYAFKSYDLKSSLGIRVIRISDISEKGLVNKNIVKYNGNEDLTQYLIKRNDILIAMTGGTVGKSLLLTEKLSEPLLLNQRVAIIRNIWINVEYLNAFLHSPYIKQIIDKKKNSTNDNISMSDLNGFLIPLPPLKEQYRIVERYKNVTSIMS